MLWTILVFIAVVITAILIFAATKPDVFRIQRSATIAAPADRSSPISSTSSVGRPGRLTRRKTRP